MLPQIDNQMNNNTQTIELPSKTYKLNLNVDDTVMKLNEYTEEEGTDLILTDASNLPIHDIILKGNTDDGDNVTGSLNITLENKNIYAKDNKLTPDANYFKLR